MPSITVDLEVWCVSCGKGLYSESSEITKNGNRGIEVNVCPVCLERAQDAEYEKGYDKGLADGRAEEKEG